MTVSKSGANQQKGLSVELSPEHYLHILLHRLWIVAAVFVVVTVATVVVVNGMPNVYSSETVILVDPQKVPESYVKPTVTGSVQNRLGTLTQQILSASRLQKIIENLGLYQEERKRMAREDVISQMRGDIKVSMVTGGSAQDLQAFRISYIGKDPRLVARVTNELASQFIDDNLKAREQQAMGTTDFLQHQLDETRKTLETHEAQLREFRMKHLGEMPEHQVATLTVLGQVQSALKQEADALARAEQQKNFYQTMMAQSVPVVDADESDPNAGQVKLPNVPEDTKKGPGRPTDLALEKAKLVALLNRFTDKHPEVRKQRDRVAELEKQQGTVETLAVAAPPSGEPEIPVPAPPSTSPARKPGSYTNPVLVTQLKAVEAEIAKHQEEQRRLNKIVASYQARLEAIPLREQEMIKLVRDYDISKSHYNQLLDRQLSAETATQLELRQKGEKFSILDPAQPAQRPTSPNRPMLDAAGAAIGLALGVVLAILPELFGVSITSPEQISQQNGNQVLEIIPMILTEIDKKRKKKQMLITAASGAVATVAVCAFLLIRFHLL